MKILLFGELIDMTKSSVVEIDAVNNIDAMIKVMNDKFPAIHQCKYKVAVNGTIAQNNILLNEDDEIALLPPFAGG